MGEVARNPEAVAFLGMMMFAGTFWGYIETFLFWHLDDLGAPRFLMGWTVAVGMVTALPFLIFSGPITDTIGHMNVIILGMLAYSARMLGYSFISDPVYVYPFEALEGLTMALMMTSAVTYVAQISTPTTIASVMGMMGALFFGVGKGSGSLFGGILTSYIGAPNTFRFFAVNAMVCALVYGFFQCLYVRPRRSREKDVEGRSSPSPTAPPSNNGVVNSAFLNHAVPVATSTPRTFQQQSDVQLSKSVDSVDSAAVPVALAKSLSVADIRDDLDHPGSVVSTGPRSITGGTRV